MDDAAPRCSCRRGGLAGCRACGPQTAKRYSLGARYHHVTTPRESARARVPARMSRAFGGVICCTALWYTAAVPLTAPLSQSRYQHAGASPVARSSETDRQTDNRQTDRQRWIPMSAEVVVAVAATAPPQERWAAQQLSLWLGALPGASSNCTLGRPHCGPALIAPSAVDGRPAIFVGADAAQAAGVPHGELHELGPDSFRCRDENAEGRAPRLILTGGLNRTDGAQPRGTINAVFEFLRSTGFRWYGAYSADEFGGFDHSAPRLPSLLPSCSEILRTTPTFRYRTVLSASTSELTSATKYWWVANHMNGGGDRTGNFISTVISSEMGGQYMFSNDTCTSSIFSLVPPISTVHKGSVNHGQFDAHPEWYALLPLQPARPVGSGDGRECIKAPSSCVRAWNISATGVPGGAGFASLCLSNPKMRQYMISEVVQKLRWDRANLGGVQLINLADNDAADAGLCHCAQCVAHRERDRATPPCASQPAGCGSTAGLTSTKYRGASGLSLEVASELQGAIALEFPDVEVWMQSYHAQLQAPKVTRPSNGVKVQFTTLHANFGQPLIHPSNNLTYSQLMSWNEIMPRGSIVIWDYCTNFNHPMVVLPNWWKMIEDTKLFASLGVSGLMFEGDSTIQTADLHEMRAWVLSQLMWDAGRDGDALIREFLVNFYSLGATNFILQHMQAYTDEIERIDYYVTASDSATAPYFSPQVIYTSLTALDRAIGNCSAASETRPLSKVVDAIRALRVSPWFLALSNWQALCAWTTTEGLKWPLPETSLHASLAAFSRNVSAILGPRTLQSEAAALAQMNASADLTCVS